MGGIIMNVNIVGNGKVHLLSGGGKCFTDVVARFVGSERNVEEIVGSEYNKNIIKNILESGHLACTEFDHFIFGIEGYSRVTEAQLIRKRLASYMIKSGRVDKGGKRKFDVVVPDDILYHNTEYNLKPEDIFVDGIPLDEILCDIGYENIDRKDITFDFDGYDLLSMMKKWYDEGVEIGIPEENLRYLKPQATEFKGVFSMNAHGLLDWFKIRCCMNAQDGVRDMANKTKTICKNVFPDLFAEAGASCVSLGYCPENDRQHKYCHIITHKEVKEMIEESKRGNTKWVK